MNEIITPILKSISQPKLKDHLELCQIGKFVCEIDSEIRIKEKPLPPAPDFIMFSGQKKIGVEHTQIMSENKTKYGKVKTLIHNAQLAFQKKYPHTKVMANIMIHNDQWDYSQKCKSKLAERIADYVQWRSLGYYFDLPENITEIRTMDHCRASFSYIEQNLQRKHLNKKRLNEEIRKKELKISGYSKSNIQMDEFWLVLFIGSLTSASYKLDRSVNYQMDSKFDRVYLMADFKAEIIRVK